MLLNRNYLFYIFILLYLTALVIVADTTPIAPSEAYRFYDSSGVVTFLMHIGYDIYPKELGIRLPFIILGILNILLYYKILLYNFDKQNDIYMALFIYLMLPGTIASAILANIAILITTLVLILIYSYYKDFFLGIIIALLTLSFIHWSVVILFLAITVFSLIENKRWLLFISLVAIYVYFLWGFPIPELRGRSSFLELLSVYATVFSPLVFIYLFYSLYRVLLRGGRDIVWYISFISLIVSFALSLKVRIKIIDFSPYIMIGAMIMVQTYYNSLRVRMRYFQKRYKVAFWIVIISLIVSSLSIILHQPIYKIVGKKNYSIVAPIYVPYELTKKLHKNGIKCTDINRIKILRQMKFYGINRCF